MKPFIVWTSCIVLGDLLLIVFCTVLMLVFTRNFSLEPSLVLYYVLGIMVLSEYESILSVCFYTE